MNKQNYLEIPKDKQNYMEISKDKQICGFRPENINLVQYEIEDCIISIFKKMPLIKSTKVIYYFCGYNDYFYHYHMLEKGFDIVVIDIPGFGFNKKYDINNNMNIYSEGKYFNYYDDISKIVKRLDLVFETLRNHSKFNFNTIYKNYNYIYGHSTGGHIVLSYISESENLPINFNRIILNSPLTRFYCSPIKVPVLNFNLDLNNFLYYSIKILGLFSKKIDMRAIVMGKKSDNSKSIILLNNLIKNIQNNDNEIDLRFKSNIGQPMLFGWINCVHSQTQKMINNKNKIKIPTILICSKSYGSNTYDSNGSNTTNAYNHDDTLNPDFICEDIKKIIYDKNENLKVYQRNTGHDIMLEPNNDDDKESWETYFKLMFN